MKKSRFSEEKIISILREADAGVKVAELVRKHGISAPTFYQWKAKYGGLDVSQGNPPIFSGDQKWKAVTRPSPTSALA